MKKQKAFYVCRYRKTDSFGFYFGEYSMLGIAEKAYVNGFNSFGSIDDEALEEEYQKYKKWNKTDWDD